jgi:hypothetical protein
MAKLVVRYVMCAPYEMIITTPVDPGVFQIIDGNQIRYDHPPKPQKNRINRPRRLSSNRRKPNVYGHRRIGHDIMPQTFYDRGHKNGLD